MISQELVGCCVRVVTWYDHARLIAAHRKPVLPEGTITQVNNHVGDTSVSVEIEGTGETFTIHLTDVELLPLEPASRPELPSAE